MVGFFYGCEGVNIVILSVVHKQVSIAFLRGCCGVVSVVPHMFRTVAGCS